MTKSELVAKTAKELLVIAKELQIVGRHEMRKEQLVDAIASRYEAMVELDEKIEVDGGPANYSGVKDLELDIAQSANVEWEHKCEVNKLNTISFPNKRGKASYIDNLRIGTIVAFKINEQKVMSGKVEEIHKESFLIATKNGPKFNVMKSNIVWVKTGDRWPKGVFLALKGKGETDVGYKASCQGK